MQETIGNKPDFAFQTAGLALALGSEALGIKTPFSDIIGRIAFENSNFGLAVLPTRGVATLLKNGVFADTNIFELGLPWLEEDLYGAEGGFHSQIFGFYSDRACRCSNDKR